MMEQAATVAATLGSIMATEAATPRIALSRYFYHLIFKYGLLKSLF
jgi:hypothetical protein